MVGVSKLSVVDEHYCVTVCLMTTISICSYCILHNEHINVIMFWPTSPTDITETICSSSKMQRCQMDKQLQLC